MSMGAFGPCCATADFMAEGLNAVAISLLRMSVLHSFRVCSFASAELPALPLAHGLYQ
jgi:hypothetical protein